MLLNALKPIHTSFFNHIIDLLHSLLLFLKKKFCYLLGFPVYICINYAVIALSVRYWKDSYDSTLTHKRALLQAKEEKKKKQEQR